MVATSSHPIRGELWTKNGISDRCNYNSVLENFVWSLESAELTNMLMRPGATPLIHSYYSKWVMRIIRTILTHGEYSIMLARFSLTQPLSTCGQNRNNWDGVFATPNPRFIGEIGGWLFREGGLGGFVVEWAFISRLRWMERLIIERMSVTIQIG